LSCLVRQAEVAMKEKEELNTGEGLLKWQKCFDCGQGFHGAVEVALGWACWKMYLGRPETAFLRCQALGILGRSLRLPRPEEALPVLEANLALTRRYWSHDREVILTAQSTLANCYASLERDDEALVLLRANYASWVTFRGTANESTIASALNLCVGLNVIGHLDEAVTLLRSTLKEAQRVLGFGNASTLKVVGFLATTIISDRSSSSFEEILEVGALVNEHFDTVRRIFGVGHPLTQQFSTLSGDILAKLKTFPESAGH